MTTPIIELARFNVVPGTPSERVRVAAARVNAALAEQGGFLSRSLAHDADTGEWIDIVHWRDLASAEAAQAAMMSHPDAQDFFALLVPDSVRMQHLTHVPLA